MTPPSSPDPTAKAGTLPPLIWIVGDRHLAQEKWHSLIGDNEFVRLDGKKLDISALVREIETLPMFVTHKYILVQDYRVSARRGASDAAGSSEDPPERDADSDKALLAALGRVGPLVTVILVSELGDKRTKLHKLVQEKGQVIDLPGFKEYETSRMAEWVVARLQSRGKRISQPLALEFVEAVGPDLGMLASEVDKISIAMGSDATVADHHLEVVAGSPVALRRLVDEGIVRKRSAQAQELLLAVLAANEAPLKILNFTIPRIRDLLKARLCPEGRREAARAAAIFPGAPPYRIRTLYEDADRFSAAELKGAIHSLVLADTCLKSSVEPEHVLSLLIAAITGDVTHEAFAQAVASYVEPWD